MKQTYIVHLEGKPESWYATRGSKSAATRLQNKLNCEGPKVWAVSLAPWSNK